MRIFFHYWRKFVVVFSAYKKQTESNLEAGTADPNNNNNAITGQIAIATGGNLNILAANEATISTTQEKNTRTLTFNNFNSSNITTNAVSSTLKAKNNNYNFDVANEINLSYNQNDFNQETGEVVVGEARQENLVNLAYLSHIKQNNDANQGGNNIVNYNPIANTNLEYHDSTRGLTDAGVAVVAVAATVATGGIGGPLAAGAAVVATSASVSGVNASMNAEGDVFKQAKTIGKDSYDAATDDETLKNAAIATLTAAVVQGISAKIAQANAVNAGANGTQAQSSTSLASYGDPLPILHFLTMQAPLVALEILRQMQVEALAELMVVLV